jgi:hypothetical protein
MSQTVKQLVTSRFTKEELNGKRVIYAFAPQEDVVAPGHGHLIVSDAGDGAMMIDIEVDQASVEAGSPTPRRWTLTQRQADALARHRDPAVADFEMFAPE